MLSHFASAEINNGAGIAAVQAIGQVRLAQIQFQTSAQLCENNAMSFDSLDNTQIAQSNMSNGCQSLLLRQSQSQMALSTAALDLQLADTKMKNDMLVNQLNNIQTLQTAMQVGGAGELGGDIASATNVHAER
jgi:hypothetical protein